MKQVKSSVLKDPSAIIQSSIPCKEMAGRMEYLQDMRRTGQQMLWETKTPFSPSKHLLSTRAKSLQRPCSISRACPSIASALVYKNELLRGVICTDTKAVLGAMFLVAFQSLPCGLSIIVRET